MRLYILGSSIAITDTHLQTHTGDKSPKHEIPRLRDVSHATAVGKPQEI